MRLPIREQLAGLIVISALIGLAVVSLATWFTNYNVVVGVRGTRLTYIAALKAGQLAANLNIMTTAVNFVSTRVLIQNALQRYNANANNTAANWANTAQDFKAAIGNSRSAGQAILHQAVVFPRDSSGPAGSNFLFNQTDASVAGRIALPYNYQNGSTVYLGDAGLGYPPNLYPNLTYADGNAFSKDTELNATTPNLVLGPWWVNETYALMSITTAVVNNTSDRDVLGFLTVVMDAVLVASVVKSREGLERTGELLIVTPNNETNRLPSGWTAGTAYDSSLEVQYIALLPDTAARHPNHIVGSSNPPFVAGRYPAIVSAFSTDPTSDDSTSSGSLLNTYNENGNSVSVGYATVDSDMVDWITLVELETAEVWQTIYQLRNVLLACVFGTAGFLLIIAFPLAHFAVLPIRRLREATRQSIAPPTRSHSSLGSYPSDSPHDDRTDGVDDDDDAVAVIARKEGLATRIRTWRQWRGNESRGQARRKREFRIPGRVKERKQWVKDELYDLTTTFNEMSDELVLQYSKLEERVQQRTAELELSKKAAEAANESKTLFIANISHELKTPLNGILGMCAVCMQEDDPVKLKRELGVIYKSGDLLLNLLNDLLQFTRNQVGQHISLEERDFRLRDVSSQILAIFDKQAKDGQIKLRVEFHDLDGAVVDGNNSDAEAPTDQAVIPILTGRLKDQVLWGDIHRILQVIINLVNNSLKFTPPGGSVTLRIKHLSEAPPELSGSRHPSVSSRRSAKKTARRHNSSSTVAGNRKHEASVSSSRERSYTAYTTHDSSNTVPLGSKYIYFAFEVQDTGPGIPPNQQQRIFEPFVQGDLGLTKKYGGTGLGLSICAQLASLMHGRMGVESTVGAGSMFYMTIPLRSLGARKDSSASSAIGGSDAQSLQDGTLLDPETHHTQVDDREGETYGSLNEGGATAKDNPQPRLVGLSQPFFATNDPLESPGSQEAAMQQITKEVERGGRIRVLVAEDNKVNQEVVLRMLKLEDIYDVTVASDGQMALDLVRDNMAQSKPPFNLIFMDVQMPNVDGIQSTKLIREMGYSAPIVALTAFAEESNIKNCLDSGMNYFLSKPIRRPQLKKVLKEYCAPIMEENEDLTPSLEEPVQELDMSSRGEAKEKLDDKKANVLVTSESVSPSSDRSDATKNM